MSKSILVYGVISPLIGERTLVDVTVEREIKLHEVGNIPHKMLCNTVPSLVIDEYTEIDKLREQTSTLGSLTLKS